MTPAIVFLIRSNPTSTHRSIEGLRIAMSFLASWESTRVILVNQAVALLSKDFDDAYDSDTLEKLLPAFKDMETPFYVEKEASQNIDFDPDFLIHPVTHIYISDMITHTSHTMVF
jgi:sulfur relay (sulfurtransferase) DsrF/TusC family protein